MRIYPSNKNSVTESSFEEPEEVSEIKRKSALVFAFISVFVFFFKLLFF